MSKLDIIIPVYNEDEKIIKLLNNLAKEIKFKFRVLICYDNDNDKTLLHLKENKIFENEILLVKNPETGPNSAILEGIKKSDAEIILVYMADDFENIKIINQMTKYIEDGNDLIIPSRFIEGGKMIGEKPIKEFVTRTGSLLIYYIAGLPYKDCTNAFKMFNKKVKNNINFQSTKGFTYSLELVAKSFILKYKIKEIPSIWREVPNRKSNFKMIKWIPFYIYWLLYAFLNNIKKKNEKNI